jgi:hypothetical protein
MTSFCRSILICALSLFTLSAVFAQAPAPATAAGSMVVGAIKAANVRGTVKKVNLIDKSETPLRSGDTLIQDNAIVTGPGDSSVILVFANGSTVKVGNESRLEIKEFLMDPLQADVSNVAALTSEPTKSRTDLRLEFGEVVGNVKTLNRAAGSTFSVSTPAGAAGIRGTTFRIVYRPTGDGRAFNFQLSTSEGVVLYQGTTQTPAAVQVPLGQEITVVAQVDPATNSVVISPPAAGGPLATVPISPTAAAALQTASVQILQTQQGTTFNQVDLQSARQQQQQQQSQQGQPPGQPGSPNFTPNQTPNPLQQLQGQQTTPPLPPAPTPRTTPGDGR